MIAVRIAERDESGAWAYVSQPDRATVASKAIRPIITRYLPVEMIGGHYVSQLDGIRLSIGMSRYELTDFEWRD